MSNTAKAHSNLCDIKYKFLKLKFTQIIMATIILLILPSIIAVAHNGLLFYIIFKLFSNASNFDKRKIFDSKMKTINKKLFQGFP